MRCLGNPLGRRGFLTVGALGGLGLSMGDLFRLRARADQKHYDFIEAKAESVIHVFLLVVLLIKKHLTQSLTAHWSIVASWGP